MIFTVKLCENTNEIDIIKACGVLNKDDLSSVDKWTYCEALLKCEGVGICGIKDADEKIKNIKTSVFNVTINGKKYSLSVAKNR